MFSQHRNLSFFPNRKESSSTLEILPDSATASSAPSNSPPSPPADPSSSSTPPYSDTSSISSTSALPDDLVSTDPHVETPTDLLTTYPADPLTETTAQAAQTLSEVIASNPQIPLKELLASPEAIHSIVSKVDLPSIGLTHGWLNIPGWIRDGLVSLHYYTDLPWWVCIIGTAIILRTLLVKFVIDGTRHNMRFAAVSKEMKPIQERMTKAQKGFKQAQTVMEKQERQTEVQVATKEMMAAWTRHDVHPLRSIKLPLLQGGVFTMLFIAVRKLASTPLPQLHEGGVGWLKDLTLPDPYYIIPLTSLILTNVIVRVRRVMFANLVSSAKIMSQVGADGIGAADAVKTPLQRHMKNIVLLITIPSTYFVSQFPAVSI